MLDVAGPGRASSLGALKEEQGLMFFILEIVADEDIQLAFGLRNAGRVQATGKGAKEHKSGK
jgi:hypothetical protein